MPKSRGREELTMLIGLEVLIESVAFDTHDLRKAPFRPAFVTKVLKSLRQAGILERVNTRKYLFTDKFVETLKEDILRKTPRSGLMQFPAMTVFDMCGVESWSEQDVDLFVKRFKQHWNEALAKRHA